MKYSIALFSLLLTLSATSFAGSGCQIAVCEEKLASTTHAAAEGDWEGWPRPYQKHCDPFKETC